MKKIFMLLCSLMFAISISTVNVYGSAHVGKTPTELSQMQSDLQPVATLNFAEIVKVNPQVNFLAVPNKPPNSLSMLKSNVKTNIHNYAIHYSNYLRSKNKTSVTNLTYLKYAKDLTAKSPHTHKIKKRRCLSIFYTAYF